MIIVSTFKVLFKNNDSHCMNCKEYDDREVAESEFHYYSGLYDFVELVEEELTRYSIMQKGELLV